MTLTLRIMLGAAQTVAHAAHVHADGMVRRLAELLGVRQENVCCVGDHANDIPMLEYAGMAFAPENAIPAVHRVPGIRILPDCRENAMAAMIAVLDRRYS